MHSTLCCKCTPGFLPNYSQLLSVTALRSLVFLNLLKHSIFFLEKVYLIAKESVNYCCL